jgi:hypothetical protein
MLQPKGSCQNLSLNVVSKRSERYCCVIYAPFVCRSTPEAPCSPSVPIVLVSFDIVLGCGVVDKSCRRLRGAKKPVVGAVVTHCICVVLDRRCVAGVTLELAIDVNVCFFLPDPSRWPPQLGLRGLVLCGSEFAMKGRANAERSSCVRRCRRFQIN